MQQFTKQTELTLSLLRVTVARAGLDPKYHRNNLIRGRNHFEYPLLLMGHCILYCVVKEVKPKSDIIGICILSQECSQEGPFHHRSSSISLDGSHQRDKMSAGFCSDFT